LKSSHHHGNHMKEEHGVVAIIHEFEGRGKETEGIDRDSEKTHPSPGVCVLGNRGGGGGGDGGPGSLMGQ